MQQDRRPHSKWSPCAGNLEHLGVIWRLPEIVRNLDRIFSHIVLRNLIRQPRPPVQDALRKEWTYSGEGLEPRDGLPHGKGPQALPVEHAFDRCPGNASQSLCLQPAQSLEGCESEERMRARECMENLPVNGMCLLAATSRERQARACARPCSTTVAGPRTRRFNRPSGDCLITTAAEPFQPSTGNDMTIAIRVMVESRPTAKVLILIRQLEGAFRQKLEGSPRVSHHCSAPMVAVTVACEAPRAVP